MLNLLLLFGKELVPPGLESHGDVRSVVRRGRRRGRFQVFHGLTHRLLVNVVEELEIVLLAIRVAALLSIFDLGFTHLQLHGMLLSKLLQRIKLILKLHIDNLGLDLSLLGCCETRGA